MSNYLNSIQISDSCFSPVFIFIPYIVEVGEVRNRDKERKHTVFICLLYHNYKFKDFLI